MLIRIAGIYDDSIVDGPGFRLSVFTQGCPHGCEGCHNPATHDFNGGREADTADIIAKMLDNPLLDGVTLTGGEPFCQPEACLEIAKAARAAGLNVWAYSGWTIEELLDIAKQKPAVADLLSETDVLADGRFVLAKRTLDLIWRGSKNQRLIDAKASVKEGRAVEANIQ